MARLNLMDLTVAQVEGIETRSGVAFDQWNGPKASKAAVYGSILVELDGRPPEAVAAMTMRELVDAMRVVLDIDG